MIKPSEVFILVFARDKKGTKEKINELIKLGYPFLIICGENINSPYCAYRINRGKYDAINYGSKFLTKDTKIICLNDVDTKIYYFNKALKKICEKNIVLLFSKVVLNDGPQVVFYNILDKIRRKLLIASSGELMLIRRDVFKKILPIPPCKTEDNYISLKTLELGYKTIFFEDCWIRTKRTQTLEEEEFYKKRTVTGIYQALSFTKGGPLIRIFYLLLPFISPLLLLYGRKGVSWMKGIIYGFTNFLSGDREGQFEAIQNINSRL